MNNYENENGICKIPGELEIDMKRGVIYFHLADEKLINLFSQVTILRICQLPPIPNLNEMLDITHMHGVSWAEQ